MNFKQTITYATILTLLAACVPPKQTTTINTKTEPAKPVTAVALNITPLKQTKLSQTKSKVTVRIEPINEWSYHWVYTNLYTQKPDEIKLFTLKIEDGKKDYIKESKPNLFYDNENVRFKITISNQSDKVIRPSGSVLTIDADGKNLPVQKSQMLDYINAIIVPNSSKEMIISPFTIKALTSKNHGTIRFGLYELKVGDKLETFEWYYNFKKVFHTIKGQSTIHTEERLYPFNVPARQGQRTPGPKAVIID
ncbi:hypothetical protein [Ghiorsea bivora]|uniref:hypothetical protein n=1 Tax=Ghiorsea bivora TaxID=1485545 RepID=UPI000570193D|nr:hypothetical protein [Ghiorsea bivora]